jgi:multidrug efflux pump
MIPLTRSAFYGPMAVAIMGGSWWHRAHAALPPALYAAWFQVPSQKSWNSETGGDGGGR